MNGAIFFWHQFEQHEAICVSKMRIDFRHKAFVHLTKVVNTVQEHQLLSLSERQWMEKRLEEIVEEFPELIQNEN